MDFQRQVCDIFFGDLSQVSWWGFVTRCRQRSESRERQAGKIHLHKLSLSGLGSEEGKKDKKTMEESTLDPEEVN